MVDVRTAAIVIVAVAAIVVPLAFVGIVLVAAIVRRRGDVLSPIALKAIAFVGGLALGSMFLVVADDLAIGLPFLVVAGLIAANEWRSHRAASAGWVIAGVALPWTLLWTAYLILLVAGVDADALAVIRGFAVGALPLAAGLVVAGRAGGQLTSSIPASAPKRSFHFVARAIREPSQIGAIPLPELAAVVAWAAVGLAMAFVPTRSELVRFAVAAVVGSALASEAYIRAMAPTARRAFEAFSWLGEQDLASLRALTRERVPLSASAARAWLARHPLETDEPPAIRSLRVQVLLLAGQVDAARAAAEARPAPVTPEDRFEQSADRQLVAWWADEPDRDRRLAGLRADAAAIEPSDGDARLRAEVALATAELRERAIAPAVGAGDAAGPSDVLAPLVTMRERLGPRADGLLRRALWRRLFAVFLATSVVFELLGLATGLVTPS